MSNSRAGRNSSGSPQQPLRNDMPSNNEGSEGHSASVSIPSPDRDVQVTLAEEPIVSQIDPYGYLQKKKEDTLW